MLREVAITLGLAALLFFSLRAAVQNFRVVGASMEPNITNGEFLLVNKLAYLHLDDDSPLAKLPFLPDSVDGLVYPFDPPQRGELVVFHSDFCPTADAGDQCIKRIIGLPGETVEVVMGQVFINGVPLEEPYLKYRDRRTPAPQRVRLDEHEYFVMGDNRPGSFDSREFGPVTLDDIIGKAWVSYWPPSVASVIRASPPPHLDTGAAQP